MRRFYSYGDGKNKIFPKYDPDGYAYVYGAKEEISYGDGDDNYETLYGVVGDDDKVIDESDILPYDGFPLLKNGRRPLIRLPLKMSPWN